MKQLLITLICLQVMPLSVMAEDDPAEIAIGERLFLETRFAQHYYANKGKADPVLDNTVTTSAKLNGPFKGKTMNCRTCHMVDEHADNAKGGMRSYADYARQSPIPARNDGLKTSARNSMSLVNISIPRTFDELFHFDGEFNSMVDLVRATLTGRNYGWQPGEYNLAIKHIASVIRNDKGADDLGQEFGGSYRKVLGCSAADIPKQFQLMDKFCADVDKMSDEQIVTLIARLVAEYVIDLTFSTDDKGNYNGSPYDKFLEVNNLPRNRQAGERFADYSKRLLVEVNKLKKPRWVSAKHGNFETHKQTFKFGKQELAGMKLFFAKGSIKQRGGNCVSCHEAPHFSDFKFHNTGLSQKTYDAIHGQGTFSKLNIPGLKKRNANYNAWLPATTKHPKASGIYRTKPAKQKPGQADLGMWNVFANPDMPKPQENLSALLCTEAGLLRGHNCSYEKLLPTTIATFKTPVIRDLGHSAPYMHTGQFDKLEDAVRFYIETSVLAKAGKLRNHDNELLMINISETDVAAITAFLKALNEDYD